MKTPFQKKRERQKAAFVAVIVCVAAVVGFDWFMEAWDARDARLFPAGSPTPTPRVQTCWQREWRNGYDHSKVTFIETVCD